MSALLIYRPRVPLPLLYPEVADPEEVDTVQELQMETRQARRCRLSIGGTVQPSDLLDSSSPRVYKAFERRSSLREEVESLGGDSPSATPPRQGRCRLSIGGTVQPHVGAFPLDDY